MEPSKPTKLDGIGTTTLSHHLYILCHFTITRNHDAHSRCVIDTSKWSSDGDEQRVLTLGWNFAVPPREIPKHDIIAEVEKELTWIATTHANTQDPRW